MKENWWKALASVLVLYSIIAGLVFEVPVKAILNETIRNLYFHVPMWFTMIFLYLISVIYSVKYLSSGAEKDDLIAVESANSGILFGILGLITGMIWAKFTWGAYWTNDPKLNGAAITSLMYLAYLVLRNSLDEEQKRAKISAIYNIFSFPVMVVLLFILPRMTDSLHPGNGGNPGFNSYDLDKGMRMVFYPAVLGWILIGVWIMSIRYRLRKLESLNSSIHEKA
jgi:heme exporter protein C